jgi:hypothetical protein
MRSMKTSTYSGGDRIAGDHDDGTDGAVFGQHTSGVTTDGN